MPTHKQTTFWTPAMQTYCTELFGGGDDPALVAIQSGAAALGFPPISVSASDGQCLRFLVGVCGARRAVEIGTLAGYSALWIARALPADGRLDCFEFEPARADFAREHLRRAAPPPHIEVHAGPALDNLHRVPGPVDFVFIDADKTGYPHYLAWAAEHLRPGGIVALDNAFAWGGLVDPKSVGDEAPRAAVMQVTLNALANDPRFVSAMIPTNEGLAVGVRR